jgi:hypothetical protein
MVMTKSDWFQCKDTGLMFKYLWSKEPFYSVAQKFKNYPPTESWENYQDVLLPIYKFHLASCRKIWELFPQEASRMGVKLAEQYIDGKISWDVISEYNWHVEAAAFTFESDDEQDIIDTWVNEANLNSEELINQILDNYQNQEKLDTDGVLQRLVAQAKSLSLPEARIQEMTNEILDIHEELNKTDAKNLLKDAAYFVDCAMMYPSIHPMGIPSYSKRKFLFPDLLREYIEYPS